MEADKFCEVCGEELVNVEQNYFDKKTGKKVVLKKCPSNKSGHYGFCFKPKHIPAELICKDGGGHEYEEAEDQGGFLAKIFLGTRYICEKCGKVIRWEA